MDIAGAYPEEAGIKKWKRSWKFEANRSVEVTDDFDIAETNGDTYFTLMSAVPVENAAGKLVLLGDGFKLFIVYDKKLTPEIEPITITDARLKNSWGGKIYRIKLHLKKKVISVKMRMVITGQRFK